MSIARQGLVLKGGVLTQPPKEDSRRGLGTLPGTTVAGKTGPTGAASTVPGPTGPAGSPGADSTVPGPTGPASTVPGPTGPPGSDAGYTGPVGPTGPAGMSITGPTGPPGSDAGYTGPVGPTGPAGMSITGPPGISVTGPAGAPGADSTVPGPTGPAGSPGADSTVPGPTGPTGPMGPKDSIVQTEAGIYAFACMEASRPMFFELVRAGEAASAKFLAAVIGVPLRFRSACGRSELLLGIRKGFGEWEMPEKTGAEMERAKRFWGQAH